MALGQARFTSNITQESQVLTFWVVHFGDHNVAGGVQPGEESAGYSDLLEKINDSFARVDIPEVVRLLDQRFGRTYSLRSLFRDEQRRIVRKILSSTVAEAEAAYLQLYENHAALMRFISRLGTPVPREFTAAIEYAINVLLKRAFNAEELDADRIKALVREAKISNVPLDRTALEFSLRQKVDELSSRFASDPSNIEKLNEMRAALKMVRMMPFPVDVWTAQNFVYAIQSGLYQRMRRRAQRGDARAKAWVDDYLTLSELLSIRVG